MTFTKKCLNMNQSSSTTGLLSELKGILKIEKNKKEIKGEMEKKKDMKTMKSLKRYTYIMRKKRKRKGKNNNEHM